MRETKKSWSSIVLALVILTCVQGMGFAGGKTEEKSADKPVRLNFSSQGMGTGMYTIASGFASLFLTVLPEGSSVNVTTDSPDTLASPFYLEEGRTDLSISGAAAAYWASHEPGLFGRPVTKKFRVLAGGLTEPCVIILMTQAFVRKSGYSTLEDVLKNKYPVNFVAKQPGSSGHAAAEAVLAEYGVKFQDIESWGGTVTLTDSSNMVDMMKDFKADMSIDNTTIGQPNWTELAMTTPISITAPSERVMKQLNIQGFSDITVPKGTFAGAVTEDLKTVGSADNLATSIDLPEDLAYLFTKTVCENKDKLVAYFAGFRVFEPEKAWEPSRCGGPLHPGAERYYKEKGWMK